MQLQDVVDRVQKAVDQVGEGVNKDFSAWAGPRYAHSVSIKTKDILVLLARIRELEQK